MNNAANVKATVTQNGANSRRDSPRFLNGEAVAKKPAAGDPARPSAAGCVKHIWDDVQ